MSRAALAAILLAACTSAQAQPLAGSPASAAAASRAAPPQPRQKTPPAPARAHSLPSGSLAPQTLPKPAPSGAKPQYAAPLQRNFAFAQDQGRQAACDELASKIDNLARHTQAAARSAPPALLTPSAINSPTPWKVPAPPVYEPPPSRPLPSANGHAPSNFAALSSGYGSRSSAHQPYPATEREAKEQRERSEQQIELETRYQQLHCRP